LTNLLLIAVCHRVEYAGWAADDMKLSERMWRKIYSNRGYE